MKYTERNIQKLLNAGLNKDYQLNEQLKKETLELLLQEVAKRKRVRQPEITLVVASSLIWIAVVALFLSDISSTVNLIYLIKLALGLSLVSIPVSSIVLIICKKRSYEKKLV
jgi:hypothetical protein